MPLPLRFYLLFWSFLSRGLCWQMMQLISILLGCHLLLRILYLHVLCLEVAPIQHRTWRTYVDLPGGGSLGEVLRLLRWVLTIIIYIRMLRFACSRFVCCWVIGRFSVFPRSVPITRLYVKYRPFWFSVLFFCGGGGYVWLYCTDLLRSY